MFSLRLRFKDLGWKKAGNVNIGMQDQDLVIISALRIYFYISFQILYRFFLYFCRPKS